MPARVAGSMRLPAIVNRDGQATEPVCFAADRKRARKGFLESVDASYRPFETIRLPGIEKLLVSQAATDNCGRYLCQPGLLCSRRQVANCYRYNGREHRSDLRAAVEAIMGGFSDLLRHLFAAAPAECT